MVMMDHEIALEETMQTTSCSGLLVSPRESGRRLTEHKPQDGNPICEL